MLEQSLKQKVNIIQETIQRARQSSPCPKQPITLLAVSKTQSVARIRACYQIGIRHFGENYAQEAEKKMTQLQALPIIWHFIGPIQSNKCTFIAKSIDWVHCLDRLKIAKRLNELCATYQRRLNMLIQINISDEANKSGIALNELSQFIQSLKDYPQLKLRGLSIIPNPTLTDHQLNQQFQIIFENFIQMKQTNPQIDTLSMGMSNDFQAAIQHGSTLVRLGTALFGQRRPIT